MGSSTEQSRLWQTGAEDYAALQEGVFIDLFRAVAERVVDKPGIRLLDIGCGPGLLCQIAAGRGARVSGLDATEAFLAIARRRTPDGDFRQGEMEALPYDDGTFDVVTGMNSFQFAESPINALREARRVARPGGRVAIGVFGKPEEVEAAAILAAIGALLPPPPPGTRGPFALSAEDALEALVRAAGLEPLHLGEVDCLWAYPDQQTILRGFLSSGVSTLAIQRVGEEAVKQAIVAAAAPFRTPDGRYEMNSKARYLVARPA